MYYTSIHPFNNKTIFYRLDVINDGFLITCKYRSKNVKVYYNNYTNVDVIIDGIDASTLINTNIYNFNDINEIFIMIDDIIYNKQLYVKTLYLKKYLYKITDQDMSYLFHYLN